MEPDIEITKKSYTNQVVVIALGLFLIALFGGYIYYGMERAKTAALLNEPILESEPEIPQDSTTDSELTVAKKQQILDALSKSPTEPLPDTKKAKILDSLQDTEVSSSPLTEARRSEILDQLNKTTDGNSLSTE